MSTITSTTSLLTYIVLSKWSKNKLHKRKEKRSSIEDLHRPQPGTTFLLLLDRSPLFYFTITYFYCNCMDLSPLNWSSSVFSYACATCYSYMFRLHVSTTCFNYMFQLHVSTTCFNYMFQLLSYWSDGAAALLVCCAVAAAAALLVCCAAAAAAHAPPTKHDKQPHMPTRALRARVTFRAAIFDALTS